MSSSSPVCSLVTIHNTMNNYYKSSFLYLVLLLYLLVQTSVLAAQNPENPSEHGASDRAAEESGRQQIEQIVRQKLGFYASRYQEIDFVLLDSAGGVARNMAILNKILGKDPVPLDYQHPESMRQALLMATLMRIELLLSTDVGSATLFKPGKEAVAKRKNVCVVTMDPFGIAKDDRAATKSLLDLSDKEYDAIPKANYLDHETYLRFSLDHEVYHCLDTMINGGTQMSKLKYWGDYHMLREESGADAYGLIMHMARQGSQDSYGSLLRRIRGLSLLNDDINHYTYQSLGLALKQQPDKLANQDVATLRILAEQISKKVIGSYEDYLRYAQAACVAVNQLGSQCVTDDYRQQAVDKDLVRSLVRDTRESYRALVGHDLPDTH